MMEQLGNIAVVIDIEFICKCRTANRLFVMNRLDNQAGSGIHVGPSGVEFDERVLALGANAEARFGASVGFPRQLPVVEGQQLFSWNIHRLGLKTRW